MAIGINIPSAEQLRELRDIARRSPLDRNAAHRWLMREAPLLALLAEIEAQADQRIFANDCALSRLVTIRELARDALARLIGTTDNPIFPRAERVTPTDQWARIAPEIGEAITRAPEGADA